MKEGKRRHRKKNCTVKKRTPQKDITVSSKEEGVTGEAESLERCPWVWPEPTVTHRPPLQRQCSTPGIEPGLCTCVCESNLDLPPSFNYHHTST